MANNNFKTEFQRLIETLSDTVQIDELAERLGISVKRSGGRALARCLFHNDTNPSMALYPGTPGERSHFHCFTCNEHGDIYDLVKKSHNCDFHNAVSWLASSYGLASTAAIRDPKPKQELAPNTVPNAASSNPSAFEFALEIYREKRAPFLDEWLVRRGVSQKTAIDAELTAAEPRDLVRYLEKKHQDYGLFREALGQLENVKLIRNDKKDLDKIANEKYLDLGRQYRDFFYDARVIFPIRDERKRLVGFAGRKVNEQSSAPKYLYSPNLPKSQILYRAHKAFLTVGADLALGERPIIYICEGLMDALRLEELGFSAVAVLGSRLSEQQARLILEFANTLPQLHPLQVRFFMDRDSAGLKGAASSIELALKLDKDIRIELGFVWPASDKNTSDTNEVSLKDPDDLLTSYSNKAVASTYLDESTQPAAVAILAEYLNVQPDDIFEDERWDSIPLGAKYRISQLLESVSGGFVSRLLQTDTAYPSAEKKWSVDVLRYLKIPKHEAGTKPDILSEEDAALRLNLARELAMSGSNKGEVLSDIASWRRMSLAATVFNEGLRSRLKQAQFQPLEPFDAIHVSRGFDKDEERLKAMPCLEDLVAQQYLMNELLTERLDDGTGKRFSNYIPAVRYYRSLRRHRTTGEIEGAETEETLSFAYQIDMDVLEGRQPPGNNGMFRPYFECWKEFISALLAQGRKMDHVHMVRLDFKRYYDRIQRPIVKDLLQRSVAAGYQKLEEPTGFVPLFQPKNLESERQNAVIDFLLEQSFGYTYFDPASGETKSTDRECGIPQGPVLSAWLGNVVLFKLDAVLRSSINALNRNGPIKAGYARYVDDVILLGDSVEILSTLRAATEDVARTLKLEVLAKETFAPMSPAEFSEHLTSGRALAGSGPREEPVLMESGDGDAGWDMLKSDAPRRQTSLELLRDPRLYTLSPETIQNQVFTALRAEDLRPSELSKAARWLWYQAAETLSNEDYDAMAIVRCYWRAWRAVSANAPFILNPDIAWDDPVFYALEGLESLFERANSPEFDLTLEEATNRTRVIAKLASVTHSPKFLEMFDKSIDSTAPPGWGSGASQLRRMFFQRIICMQWKAVRLTGSDRALTQQNASVQNMIGTLSATLQGSLKRSLITDAETWKLSGTAGMVSAQGHNDRNPLADAFLWLHRSVVAFGVADSVSRDDPLAGYQGELEQIANRLADVKARYFAVSEDRFLPILKELLCKKVDTEENPTSAEDEEQKTDTGKVLLLALQTLAAITPREHLAHFLANRAHLFQDDGAKLPLPPLPGIPANGLLLISPTDVDEHWTKISALWWITISREEEDALAPSLPIFKAASAGGTIRDIVPKWELSKKVEQLEIFKAPWGEGNEPSLAFVHAPILRASARALSWTADAFEAIARLNHLAIQDIERSRKEYVPAWPYFVSNTRPDIQSDASLSVTLLSAWLPTSTVDGLAFVRNGASGLRTYDIPEIYGRHWRTGVMFTDMFGFQRELDQYAALHLPDLADKDGQIPIEPAEHILRNVLRKLRGAYAQGSVLKSQSGDSHIPATIQRSLELLRGFPKDGDLKQAIAYLLSSEAETAAMHTRLSGNVALEYKGIAAAYATRIALRLANRIPIGWSDGLPPSPSNPASLPTTRRIPKSYFDLSFKLESLFLPTLSLGNGEKGLATAIAGFRIAGISAWLREITLSIEALDDPGEWPLPSDGDTASAWQLDEGGFLFSEPSQSVSSLSEYFRKRVLDDAIQRDFSDITPLGWLTLLSGRVGLLGNSTRRPLAQQWAPEVELTTKLLAQKLSIAARSRPIEEDDVDPDWPFEFDDFSVLEQWLSPNLLHLTSCIAQIEINVGLQLLPQQKASWRFAPSDCSFVDSEGEKWEIKPWQIVLSNGTKPERIKLGRRLLNIWDETRDRKGNLVLVAGRDDRLAKILGETVAVDGTHPKNGSPDSISIAESTDTTVARDKEFESETLNVAVEEITSKEDAEQQKSQAPTPEKTPSSGGNSAEIDKNFNSRLLWRSLQEDSWNGRGVRSPGHIRVAIMQWNLDETYHHPIYEADRWNKGAGWPPIETSSFFEVSAIESRRRKLISETLDACERFSVDILVLPEYSVRPDTVKWLRNQLLKKSGMPSVLAGTYMLHGNIDDIGFEETHKEILGLSDYQKAFGTGASSKGLYSSGEHGAMLTLLTPLELKDGKKIVCTFSRRKKYPSLAASEIFNPNLDPLRPLFSSEGLLEEIMARASDGSRTPNGMGVSAKEILGYSRKLRNLEFLSEFICSELFLPMSVSNHNVLATELQKLARRFGASTSMEWAQKSVIEDVALMSKYLGSADPNGEITRRSIFVVPAMTTRSADYWIFGQAALLSGGATTVFCNAVKKKYAVGGSCFIGRDSWSEGTKALHPDERVTPYAGWSKGIFYHQKMDALGANEQAVVIADIDPSFMQEGKPRPQALAVPLQLVAYLPIVEVSGLSAKKFCVRMTYALNGMNIAGITGRLVKPTEAGLENIAALISKHFDSNEGNPFNDRFGHWKKYWRVNPSAGIPAALVDWLWVDTTNTDLNDVRLFVPSCTGDVRAPRNADGTDDMRQTTG